MKNKTGIEYITFKGKHLGTINYDKQTYYSKRSIKKHFFQIYSGWGLSLSVISKLEEENIEKIVLIITDSANQTLETNITNFLVHGVEWTDKTFGKEEKQLILPIQFWNKKIQTEFQMKI